MFMEIPKQSLICDIDYDLFDLELDGGYQGCARLFNGSGDGRAVLYLHGIQSHSGWFLRSCDHLRRQGAIVLAPDRRGSGLNGYERGHCNSHGQLIADVDCCVDWLRQRTGIQQIDIVAVSWSGKLTLAYAAEFPDKVRSIALVTPGLCAKVDISLREKITIGLQGVVNPHRLHEIPLNDPELFTANPDMLRFIENDPIKLTHATAAFFIASTHLDSTVRKIVSKLKLPVYLFLAENDRIIDNRATIELLKPVLTGLPSPAETVRVYPNAHHTLDFEPDPLTFFQDLALIYR